MNIKQAKQIPIQSVVLNLGGKESTKKGQEIWYYSPFRPEEKTPSFKVNLRLNTWFDFGTGSGGSVIDLLIDFKGMSRNSKDDIRNVLLELKNFENKAGTGIDKSTTIHDKAENQTKGERYKILKKPSKVWLPSLQEEIASRGLDAKSVNRYLRQVYFLDLKTNKRYNAIGFENDKQSWELSIPNRQTGKSFKTIIGQKGVSTFYHDNATRVLVFEGFWDFLSWQKLHDTQAGSDSVIVLNSTALVKDASNIIESWIECKEVLLFLDNDDAGFKATHLFAELLESSGKKVWDCSDNYTGFKDVNDLLRKNPLIKSTQASQEIGEQARNSSNIARPNAHRKLL